MPGPSCHPLACTGTPDVGSASSPNPVGAPRRRRPSHRTSAWDRTGSTAPTVAPGLGRSSLVTDLLGKPATAHYIGGAVIGASAATGVVDPYHRVFGYDGLHVIDGSTIGANLGVNPSLTITAMAERAVALWPNQGDEDPRPPAGERYRSVPPVPPVPPVPCPVREARGEFLACRVVRVLAAQAVPARVRVRQGESQQTTGARVVVRRLGGEQGGGTQQPPRRSGDERLELLAAAAIRAGARGGISRPRHRFSRHSQIHS